MTDGETVELARRDYELACVDEHDAWEAWRAAPATRPGHVIGCQCAACPPLQRARRLRWLALEQARVKTLDAKARWRSFGTPRDGATS